MESTRGMPLLHAFGGEDPGEAGEVIGDEEIGPLGRFEEWADSR